MRAHLVHNPRAGDGKSSGEDLVRMLRNAGIDARYCGIRSDEFPARLKEPADLVVVAGGDGTVRKVMARYPDRSVPLALLPLGTSNNVARSLGIEGEIADIIAGWHRDRTCPFDTGIAVGPWGERAFVEAVGWGALAAANEKAGPRRTAAAHSMLRGRDALVRRLRKAPPFAAALDIDGRTLEGRWLLIEALNTRYTGPRLMLSPTADPGDGTLDILCVADAGRSDMLDWLAAPDGLDPPVEAVRGRRLTMRWDGRTALRIDDKLCDRERKAAEVVVTLHEQPLTVLLPPASRPSGNGGQRKPRAKAAGTGARETEALLPKAELLEVERIAVEFATLAGAEIASALGGLLAVRYKGPAEAEQLWRDPVSEVDQRVEQLIRSRLADRFPDHGVIGEEIDEERPQAHDVLWVIDPIDGTANFVNGFPLFAASIGVLHRGWPVAGALWCSSSHALRAGVYHASRGGRLRFDGDDVVPRANPEVRRRLAGVPAAMPGCGRWDTRKTGSAAIECAFVAAGLLEAARFDAPNLWDVAGGVMLVQASGGTVLTRSADRWAPLDRFQPPSAPEANGDIRRWNQPVLIGRVEPDRLVQGLVGG